VKRQPDRPNNIIYAPPEECVQMLLTKEVSAVMTDVTTLTWMASYAQIPGAYVSPVLQANPFAFVCACPRHGYRALRARADLRAISTLPLQIATSAPACSATWTRR
jgi:hypothetical protein